MTSTRRKSPYWTGVRHGAPFILVVTPFALLFGVVATEAGLSIFETMVFTITTFAGAAQFTALQLLGDNTPTIVVLLSSLAVNLRMAMYSASLTPYIGGAPLWQRAFAAYLTVDQSYAMSMQAVERYPDWGTQDRIMYFFGVVTPIAPMWYIMTLVGALVGSAIPAGFALDFAVPITFLAMIAPMLRTVAHIAAAFVAVVLSLTLTFVPFNLGLILAGFGGMITGAFVELLVERRKKTTQGGKP